MPRKLIINLKRPALPILGEFQIKGINRLWHSRHLLTLVEVKSEELKCKRVIKQRYLIEGSLGLEILFLPSLCLHLL